jgi:hypothetical protein
MGVVSACASFEGEHSAASTRIFLPKWVMPSLALTFRLKIPAALAGKQTISIEIINADDTNSDCWRNMVIAPAKISMIKQT